MPSLSPAQYVATRPTNSDVSDDGELHFNRIDTYTERTKDSCIFFGLEAAFDRNGIHKFTCLDAVAAVESVADLDRMIAQLMGAREKWVAFEEATAP